MSGTITMRDSYVALVADGRKYIGMFFGPAEACRSTAAKEAGIAPKDVELISVMSRPMRLAELPGASIPGDAIPAGKPMPDSELAASAGRILGIASGEYAGLVLAMIHDRLLRMHADGDIEGIPAKEAVGIAVLAAMQAYEARTAGNGSRQASEKCMSLLEEAFGDMALKIWPVISEDAVRYVLERTERSGREISAADAAYAIGRAIACRVGAADR